VPGSAYTVCDVFTDRHFTGNQRVLVGGSAVIVAHGVFDV
jgi:predicted PhzF superfamily epimerase YddE/YHI9